MNEQQLDRIRYWQSRPPEERFAETVRLSIEMYAKQGFDPRAKSDKMIRMVPTDQISKDDW